MSSLQISAPQCWPLNFKKEAQWPIGYGVGLRIKRSSVQIRLWPLRWVLGQGSLLPLSQGEAFTLASISYLAILVKSILKKKKKNETGSVKGEMKSANFGKGKCKLIANFARQWWHHFRLSSASALPIITSISIDHLHGRSVSEWLSSESSYSQDRSRLNTTHKATTLETMGNPSTVHTQCWDQNVTAFTLATMGARYQKDRLLSLDDPPPPSALLHTASPNALANALPAWLEKKKLFVIHKRNSNSNSVTFDSPIYQVCQVKVPTPFPWPP